MAMLNPRCGPRPVPRIGPRPPADPGGSVPFPSQRLPRVSRAPAAAIAHETPAGPAPGAPAPADLHSEAPDRVGRLQSLSMDGRGLTPETWIRRSNTVLITARSLGSR